MSQSVPFIGRQEALADVETALEQLLGGRGGVVLLSGPAGIGKTRLAREMGERARSRGLAVHWGRCHDAESRPPYWPWLQILQAAVEELGADAVAHSLGAAARPVARLVPALRARLGDTPAEAESESESATARFAFFLAMVGFLRQWSARQPRLLLLDDLQWADVPSLLMLDFLAHDLSDLAVVVVATFRDGEVRTLREVDEILGRISRRAHSITLSGFTLAEAARFIETATGQPVPDSLAQRVHQGTDGHPFFLAEVVRLLDGDGHWAAAGGTELPISPTVRGSIQGRLAPLSAGARAVLYAAAVAGREFDLPLLEHGTRQPRADLLVDIGPALAAEIIVPSGGAIRYRFTHDLIRHAIYDMVPLDTRTTLHRAFAEVLERRDRAVFEGRAAEIANHYAQAAAAGGEEKAIIWAERAGREALQSLASEEAVVHFTRALELSTAIGGEARRHCELLLALGDAKTRAGFGDQSIEPFREAAALARRAGASDLLARAAIGLSDVGAWPEYGRVDHDLIRLLEDTLVQLGDGADVLRARVIARLAIELCWVTPPSHTDTLSAEAVTLGRRAGDKATLAYTLLARIECLYHPNLAHDRVALGDEVLSLTGGRGEAAMRAYFWRLGDAMHLDRMEEAATLRAGLVQSVRLARQPRDAWIEPAARSLQSMMEGHFTDAREQLNNVLAQGSPPPAARQTASSLMIRLRTELGQYDGLADLTRSVAQQYPDVPLWSAGLASVLAESGALDDARSALATMVARLPSLRRDRVLPFCLACLAQACWYTQDKVSAQPLYQALLPYDGRNVVTGPGYFLGPVAYHLGLLAGTAGRRDEAVHHFEHAIAAARRMGAQPFLARALLAMASVMMPSAPDAATRYGQEGAALASTLGIAVPRTPAGPNLEDFLAPALSPSSAMIVRDGDTWAITHDGQTARLRASKGLSYLARLLAEPGKEVHVLDLVRLDAPPPAADVARHRDEGLDAMLDDRARADLQRRRAELTAARDAAERAGDLVAARADAAERDFISQELGRALGLGGRARLTGSTADRARASVTKAVRAAIAAIAPHFPALADALQRDVRTGAFCVYAVPPDGQISWTVTHGK